MTFERIDTLGHYTMALKAVGLNVDSASTELILQTVKLIDRKKGEASLSELYETKFSYFSLLGLDENGSTKE